MPLFGAICSIFQNKSVSAEICNPVLASTPSINSQAIIVNKAARAATPRKSAPRKSAPRKSAPARQRSTPVRRVATPRKSPPKKVQQRSATPPKKYQAPTAARSTSNASLPTFNMQGEAIRSVPTSLGAGASTRKSNNMRKLSPYAASQALAAKDADRIRALKAQFEAAGQATGVHPAIAAAIASRETAGGRQDLLTASGWSKSKGNKGYGIMQVDQKAHPGTANVPYNSQAHIQQALEIYKNSLAQVQARSPNWTLMQQMQAAADRYNGGPARNLQHLDRGSTGGDYGGDVMARAQYYYNIFHPTQ